MHACLSACLSGGIAGIVAHAALHRSRDFSCRFTHEVKAYLEKMGPDIGKLCPVWDVRGVSTERSVETASYCCRWNATYLVPFNKHNTPPEMNSRAVIHQNMGGTLNENDCSGKNRLARSLVASFGACTLLVVEKTILEIRARVCVVVLVRQEHDAR